MDNKMTIQLFNKFFTLELTIPIWVEFEKVGYWLNWTQLQVTSKGQSEFKYFFEMYTLDEDDHYNEYNRLDDLPEVEEAFMSIFYGWMMSYDPDEDFAHPRDREKYLQFKEIHDKMKSLAKWQD